MDCERIEVYPPAFEMDSDVGEYMAMIPTKPMLNRTLKRDVFARSAISRCKLRGSITAKLEIIKQGLVGGCWGAILIQRVGIAALAQSPSSSSTTGWWKGAGVSL